MLLVWQLMILSTCGCFIGTLLLPLPPETILTFLFRSHVISTYVNTSLPARRGANKTDGVYRLAVSLGNLVKVTSCIPYHASAQQLADILGAIPIIQNRGGVTVRRYGDGQDSTFGYGYTYRIEMDAPSTPSFAGGPASISLLCQGADASCACGQTVVNLTDSSGVRRVCPVSGRIAPFNNQGCVIPPTISLVRVDSLSYTYVTGAGELVIDGGYHRLPPIMNVSVQTTSGTAVISGDVITWTTLQATNIGRFVFAGKGWAGWQNAIDLFQDASTDERGLLSYLNTAPPFTMSLQHAYLSGLGAVFSVCPNSTLHWANGVWSGGMIGGRSTLYIQKSLLATGTGKALRYAMSMIILNTATFTWTQGNISLANGANITVNGKFEISSLSGEQYIGEAQLLGGDTDAARELLAQEPQLQWHGYFDDTLPSELRGGFYQNPLCAGKCLTTNQLNLRQQGSINVSSHTLVTFSVPLNMYDVGTLNVQAHAHINLASGGICDVLAVMTMGNESAIELSGGNMLMGSTCKIVGLGELLVSAGMHDLGDSIDAHITISGGYMIWPLNRGIGHTISFNGGLTIDNTGVLQVQPFSTSIGINNNKTVILRDQGIIQFPDIGTAAEPSLFDETDAPDAFPSGHFTVQGVMYFHGGTLTGKAQYDVMTALYLRDDTKYISSLSILQSYGHAEWASGNLITSTGGNFKNFGTLQMANGPESFGASALNLDEGISSLEFHSWDLGEGSLDYGEYIALRSVFVSKVPPEFSSENQLARLNAIY
jgi:hypothetical protein